MVDEKSLIKRCQNGENDAFDELIRKYYKYVSKFLLKACRNVQLSEDLTQETFIKMIRNIDKYNLEGRAGFGTWLITIAKNEYIDCLRIRNIVIDDIDIQKLQIPIAMQQETVNTDTYEEVLKMIETLPKEQAAVIKMKYLEELTLEEISLKLSVPPKTIKSRIHEGTVKIRNHLKRKEGEELQK